MRRELKAVLAVVAGLSLLIGGNWIIWDWINSIVYFLDWTRFMSGWSFPAPLFIYRWDAMHWTGPYDTALAMQVIGIVLLVLGVYVIARYRE